MALKLKKKKKKLKKPQHLCLWREHTVIKKLSHSSLPLKKSYTLPFVVHRDLAHQSIERKERESVKKEEWHLLGSTMEGNIVDIVTTVCCSFWPSSL